MHGVIEELNRIVAGGMDIVACADSESPQLQDWVSQRERVFGQLDHVNGQLREEERRAVSLLIDEILKLDATILSRLEQCLNDLGDEIATNRRLRSFLGASVSSERPSLLRRTI